jgi:hypothetical protein
MGFPNPKPRNIEKDVKVFPWEVLGSALKKIIGKYVSHSQLEKKIELIGQSASYQGAVSPALSSHMLPYMPYAQPSPLQPADGMMPPHMHSYESHSTESIPSLTANTSTDSSGFPCGLYDPHADPATHMSHISHPHSHTLSHTHLPQHHMHPHAQSQPHEESPSHYRSNSGKGPQHTQHGHHAHHGEYVNISPTHMSSYSGTTSYYPGMADVGSPTGGSSYGHPMPGPAYVHHQPGQLDHPQQLPHVHQSTDRHSSSSDLRVVYPNLAQ